MSTEGSKEEGGIKAGYAYPIIGCKGNEEVCLKSNFGALKGFGYNDKSREFSMSVVEF